MWRKEEGASKQLVVGDESFDEESPFGVHAGGHHVGIYLHRQETPLVEVLSHRTPVFESEAHNSNFVARQVGLHQHVIGRYSWTQIDCEPEPQLAEFVLKELEVHVLQVLDVFVVVLGEGGLGSKKVGVVGDGKCVGEGLV